MAENLGMQAVIGADISDLIKKLDEVKKALGSVAQESQKQADGIGDPLKKAADQISEKYGWLAGELAKKLIGLVNPAGLAAAAVTAIGAAVVAYIESTKEKVFTLDEVMKRHAETIKGIGKAYPQVVEELKNFAAETNQYLQTRVRGDLQRTQDQMKLFGQEFIKAVADPQARSGIESLIMSIGGLKESVFIVKKEFDMFRTPILEFGKSIREGKPDVDAFKKSLDAIPDTTPEIIKLKNEIIDLLDKGLNRLSGEAKVGEEALRRLGLEASGAAAATRAFDDAIKTLKDIEPKQIDDLTRANNTLTEAMKLQSLTEEQRIALKQEHADTITRLKDAANAAAAEEARVAAEAAAREAESLKQKEDAEKQFLVNSLNNLTLSWGTREEKLWAHLTREQELIDAALEKKVINDEAHKALMERAEEEHQKKLQKMREATNMQALNSTASMFGSLQTLTEAFGKKGNKTAKAFGIAKALINTYVGATKALELPFPANMAAFAATMAQGLAAVASIRSVSESGSGGGAASSGGAGGAGAAAAASGTMGGGQPGGNSVYINLQGQSFGRDQVRALVEQIASYQKDGGQVVFA